MTKISLRGARVDAGYSQKDAATALGISNATLCNWEKGISYPDAPQIDAICKLYNRSYDEINFLPNNPIKTDLR